MHRARIGVSVILLVALAGTVAALADRGEDEAPSPNTVAATTLPATVPPGTPSGQPITLAFAGDVNYDGPDDAAVEADPAARLAPMAEYLSGADLAVVNLETAITDGGTPAPKQFTFRASAGVLDGLAANGVDVVSVANNHGMDYGRDGLRDTLTAAEASPVAVIGAGRSEEEAFAPFRATVRGQRVAVIAATQVLDGNLIEAWTAAGREGGLASAKRVDRLVAEVERARLEADTVVVFLHWGVERQTCPSADQERLARRLVDAGADVIVGSHAHRLQGGGMLDAAAVHYGLGNFGFYAASAGAAQTGVFTVTVRGRRIDDYRWIPGEIRNRVPFPLSGDAADQALTDWQELRSCTNLSG